MNRYRKRRLRVRFSILAIVALLWSQVVLAGHPGCSMAAMALAEVTAQAAGDHGCDGINTSNDSTVCNAHCSESDKSSDVVRVPPVPELAAVQAIGTGSIAMLYERALAIELPPAVSWHRPTSHPANILLI